MKKTNLLITLLFIVRITYSQVYLSGNIINVKNLSSVNLCVPADGFYSYSFILNKYSCPLSSDGFFHKVLDIRQGGFLTVYTGVRPVFLYVSPGDSINIRVNGDLFPFKEWLKIEGRNAFGHTQFNINYMSIDPFIRWKALIDIVDTAKFSSICNLTEQQIKTAQKPYDSLLVKGMITLKYHNMIANELMVCFRGIILERINMKYKGSTDSVLTTIKEKWLNPKTVFDSTIYSTLSYGDLLLVYFDTPFCYSKYRITELDQFKFKRFNIYSRYAHAPDKVKSFMFAGALSINIKYGSNEFDSNWGINFYRREFPNSGFIPFIDEKYKQGIKNIKKIKSEVIFLDSTKNYSTLKNLINQNFNDSFVFVDLWASWCTPCRMEFQYSNQLHDFLKKHNVKMLYISIDEAKRRSNWRKVALNSGLAGYHYLAGEQLINDIEKQLYSNGERLSVPRYILIGSSGEILTNNAPRPSSKDELYDKILELMGK